MKSLLPVLFFLAQQLLFCQHLSKSEADHVFNIQLNTFKKVFAHPRQAKITVDSLIKNTNLSWPDSLKANNYNIKGSYFTTVGKQDSAVYYFEKNISLLDTTKLIYPRMINNLGVVLKKKGDYKRAFYWIDKGIGIARRQNNQKALQLLYGLKSTCYARLQNYPLAIEYQKMAIEIIEKNNLTNDAIYMEYHNLANLYMNVENYKIAIEMYEDLLPKIKTVGLMDTYYLTALNLSNSYIGAQQLSRADSLIGVTRPKIQEYGDPNIISYSKELKALILEKNENFVEAVAIYQKVFEKSLEINNERLYTIAYNYLGLLENLGQHEKAEQLVLKVLAYENTKEDSQFGILAQLEFYKKAKEYLKENDKKSYDELLLRTIELQDSLQRMNDGLVEKQLELEYENKAHKNKNMQLEQQLMSTNVKFWLTFGGLSSLIILSFLGYKRSIKNHQLKVEKIKAFKREQQLLAEKLQQEKEINQLKRKKIEKQKAEMLALTAEQSKIQQKYSAILDKLDDTTQQKIQEQLKEITRGDEYWDVIKEKFLSINPHFISQLKTRVPRITSTQIDFCALIKMRLSNKEIAKVLGVTHESVISRKYRLKKKFNLEKETDFTRFIEDL